MEKKQVTDKIEFRTIDTDKELMDINGGYSLKEALQDLFSGGKKDKDNNNG